jgi:hypothetical protein
VQWDYQILKFRSHQDLPPCKFCFQRFMDCGMGRRASGVPAPGGHLVPGFPSPVRWPPGRRRAPWQQGRLRSLQTGQPAAAHPGRDRRAAGLSASAHSCAACALSHRGTAARAAGGRCGTQPYSCGPTPHSLSAACCRDWGHFALSPAHPPQSSRSLKTPFSTPQELGAGTGCGGGGGGGGGGGVVSKRERGK